MQNNTVVYCQFEVESDLDGARTLVCPKCKYTIRWKKTGLPMVLCRPDRPQPVRGEIARPKPTTRKPLTPEEKAEQSRRAAERKAKNEARDAARRAEKKEKIVAYVREHQPCPSSWMVVEAKKICGCINNVRDLLYELRQEGVIVVDDQGQARVADYSSRVPAGPPSE